MDKGIYQLTYRSKAREGLTTEQVMEIVDEAISFNRRSDITGCLVFDQGYFIQILEGEKDAVVDLYQKIKKDDRHQQPEILSRGWAPHRMFSSWKMGFINMKEMENGEKKGFVKEARQEMEKTTVKHDFTPKVFWYNVFHLLEGTKFYGGNGPL